MTDAASSEWPPPPNPGSAEARDAGCICPVLDNNHGKFAPCPDDGWWVNGGCPLHDPETIEEADHEASGKGWLDVPFPCTEPRP